MYAYIQSNQIKKQGKLPKTWTLQDGKTVSGFHLLDVQILKQEGWLPIEEINPNYNAETQYLTNPQYEILEDKVIKTWQVADIIIEPQEPTIEEVLDLKIAQNTAVTIELVATLNEMQKIEQAQSNAELIELIMMMGGM